MNTLTVIGIVLIVIGLVVLWYEEVEHDYKNPERIKYAIYAVIIGAVLSGIGQAI